MDRGFANLGSIGSFVPKGRNHLFVIGIDDYQNVPKLLNAKKDAENLIELLHKYYTFDLELTTTLFDKEATESGIYDGLKKQINALQEGDNLIVYFSGHGHYDKTWEEGYWVPVDGDKDKFETTSIPYSFLLDKFVKAADKKKAQHVLFLVDSCYSGAVLVNKKRNLNIVADRLERDPSRYIIASGRNEVVSDGAPGKNSPFASELIGLLKENTSGGINTLRLIDRLTENVIWNSDQAPIGTPLDKTGHRGGQFIFHPRQNESLDWINAEKNDTKDSYEVYLKSHKDGKHAEEAAWRIAQILDTEKAYDSFYQKFPQGKYHEKALELMALAEERETWDKVRKSKKSSLISFINRNPESHYIDEAKSKLAELRKKPMSPVSTPSLPPVAQTPAEDNEIAIAKKHKEEKAQQEAEAEKLRKEKEAKELKAQQEAKAQAEVEKLRKEEEAKELKAQQEAKAQAEAEKLRLEKVALKRKDNRVWKKAQTTDTIESYQSYLDEFSDGLHVEEAKAAKKRKEEEAPKGLSQEETNAWTKAQKENTSKAYKAYLDEFPGGFFAEEAKAFKSIPAKTKPKPKTKSRPRKTKAKRTGIAVPEDKLMDWLKELENSIDDFYVMPNISSKKLNNINFQNYKIPKTEKVLAVVDSTTFGSAKTGLVFGLKGIYYNNDSTSKQPGIHFINYWDFPNRDFDVPFPSYREMSLGKRAYLSSQYGKKRLVIVFNRIKQLVGA